jgi:hypothetical protein
LNADLFFVTRGLREVDFGTAVIRNLTRMTEQNFSPLPEALLQTIRMGGWEAQFAGRLTERSR